MQIFAYPYGTWLRTFGEIGAALGQVNCPGGVVVDPFGQIAICEVNNSRGQIFDSKGNALRTFGTQGGTGINGDLGQVCTLAVDQEGRYVVADYDHLAIQIFANDGTWLTRFTTPEGSACDSPVIDRDSNIIVVDLHNSKVLIFG